MKNLKDKIYEGFFSNIGEPELAKLYKLGFKELKGTKELWDIPGFILNANIRGQIIQVPADYKQDDPDGMEKYDITKSTIYVLPNGWEDKNYHAFIYVIDDNDHLWCWSTFKGTNDIKKAAFASGPDIHKLKDPKNVIGMDWSEKIDSVLENSVTVPEMSYFKFSGPLKNAIEQLLDIDINKLVEK